MQRVEPDLQSSPDMVAIRKVVFPDDLFHAALHLEARPRDRDARIVHRSINNLRNLTDFSEVTFTVQLERRHVANTAFQSVSLSNRVVRYHFIVKIAIFFIIHVHQKLAELRERLYPVKKKDTAICLVRESKIEVGKLLGV